MALKGVKVLELAGLAPAPFCGLVLSDFGAQVLRIDRPHNRQPDCLKRGKKSIFIDLKSAKGKEIVKRLSVGADVVIEPFRPGVMESLSLGPKDLMAINDRLIYARLTGYGQSGPLARAAGHDINYLAISGILSRLGTTDTPSPPINIIGDFAGGGLICALGICMALLERTRSGRGQVVDSSITEGTAYVSQWIWHSMSADSPARDLLWPQLSKRGGNLLDGCSPFYRCYRTKDDKFMAVGALEPQFYDRLVAALGLDADKYNRYDVNDWQRLAEAIGDIFATKTQSEWTQVFEKVDACVTPVLDLQSVHQFPHNRNRESFFSDGTPKPSPLLSRTPAVHTNPTGDEIVTKEVLQEMGYSDNEIKEMAAESVIELPETKSKL
ncbi:unnamed protein product [Medioppia subpectinata]|uniref:Alpha-methylacyl-CoA racemase n=1 Tax=Medioppia subpectinata TaxID=1979941 RepID=A0A7R9KLR6_9ACAR|nr:unnamed protein product [Medioppia subpectinata]CAG2105817.1 unnamed protein product [Medioppia subpectinata]